MSETRAIRVMIVDDHDVVRRGLKIILDAFEEFTLVGEADHGEEAVRLCAECRPDVVLMDMMMPGMNGATATRAIREILPQTQIVALTSFKEETLVRSALQAGALGYLLKTASMDEVAEAIRAAAQGRRLLAPEVIDVLIASGSTPSAVDFQLTDREREVLALMVEGLTNPKIAKRLTVSLSTIKFHISSILSKLGADSRAAAVAIALQNRLLD